MAYSFSKLRDWACPYRYHKKHVEGLSEPSTTYATVGKIAADLMAEIRLARYEQGRDTEAEERRGIAYKAALNHLGSEEEAESALAIVEGSYSDMADLLPSVDMVHAQIVEKGIAFDGRMKRIDELPEAAYYGQPWEVAHWKCKPDFVWMDTSGVLHVEDDKSGWNEADPRQLLSYAWSVREALRQKGKDEPAGITLHFNYLAMKKRVEVSASEVDSFPAWLSDRVAEIETATEFPPYMGKHCDYCGFVAECPLHEKTRQQLATLDPEKLTAITTPEQAERAGMFILSAQRLLDAAKALTRVYVEEHGPVALPGTGMVLELRGGEPSLHAPAGNVLEALLEHGIPKSTFYSRIKLSKRDVDDVLGAAFPLGGKGIDRNVKAHNLGQRAEVYKALDDVWTKSPRARTFGIYKAREGS